MNEFYSGFFAGLNSFNSPLMAIALMIMFFYPVWIKASVVLEEKFWQGKKSWMLSLLRPGAIYLLFSPAPVRNTSLSLKEDLLIHGIQLLSLFVLDQIIYHLLRPGHLSKDSPKTTS